jgi:hypothetical protein
MLFSTLVMYGVKHLDVDLDGGKNIEIRREWDCRLIGYYIDIIPHAAETCLPKEENEVKKKCQVLDIVFTHRKSLHGLNSKLIAASIPHWV